VGLRSRWVWHCWCFAPAAWSDVINVAQAPTAFGRPLPIGRPLDGWPKRGDPRLPFAALLLSFAVAGTLWLGFNRSPAQIAITVGSACVLDAALHWLLRGRRLLFPLSAFISSLSLALLLNYGHDHLLMLLPVFLTVGSKYVFTFRGRHVINPSLFGVVGTLVFAGDLITASPAYQWDGTGLVSLFMVAAAASLFLFKVGRAWLVGSFLFFYVLQTALRAWLTRHHIPMDMLFVGTLTSPPFFLFTFFMMTDPATSPSSRKGQVFVAALIAGIDLAWHAKLVLFTFFYAAGMVQTGRFVFVHAKAMMERGEVLGYLKDALVDRAVLKRVAVVLGLGLLGLGLYTQVLRPHVVVTDVGARYAPVDVREAGVVLEHDGELLTLMDERAAHIAKWVLSVGASVATADVDNDGDQDLFFTSPTAIASDRSALFLNDTPQGAAGAMRFTRHALPEQHRRDADPRTHGYTSGSLFFDADNDGDQDLLLLVTFGSSRLLQNRLIEDGALAFVDVTEAAGLDTYTNSVAAGLLDLDRDGALDLVIRNVAPTHLPGYEQPTRYNLFKLPAPAHEGDRRMFAFMHNSWHKADNGGPTHVWRNRGDGTFEALDAADLGLTHTHWTLAMSAADLDGDGVTDLYLGNDFGPDDLYLRRGDRFEHIVSELYGEIGKDTYKGMNSTAADVTGDGRLDIYVSNAHVPMLAEGSLLWINKTGAQGGDEGRVQFVDEAMARGALNEGHFGWGAAIADLNLDGWPEIIQGNGYLDDRFDQRWDECPGYWYSNHKLMQSGPELHTYGDKWADLRGYCVFPRENRRVFLNRGTGAQPQFVDATEAFGPFPPENSRGIAATDLDGDGTLDVVMSNQLGPPQLMRGARSASGRRKVVSIDLVGDPTHPTAPCSKDAVGTEVRIELGDGLVRSQQVQGLTGLSAQSGKRLHFGLGEVEAAAIGVEVVWCGHERSRRRLELAPNSAVVLYQTPPPSAEHTD
jgi:hypothetical protein